tara:strand:+ start:11122 stop:12051 length:930 start_codon:yes stop_codon:yes gene_type:complete
VVPPGVDVYVEGSDQSAQVEFREEPFDVEQAWTLAQGTAYHEAFQDELLRSLGRVLQGWWKCRVCGAIHVGGKGQAPLPANFFGVPVIQVDEEPPESEHLAYGWVSEPEDGCGACSVTQERYARVNSGRSLFSYFEVSFKSSEELPTSGHVDGILEWGEYVYDGDPEIQAEVREMGVEHLEIKTINERGFRFVDPEQYKEPKEGHIVQACPYREALGIERTRFLYLNKGAKKFAGMTAEHRHEWADLWEQILVPLRIVFDTLRMKCWEGPLPPMIPECCKKGRTSFRPKYLCVTPDLCFDEGDCVKCSI